jgi:hypothetical protein
MNAREFLEEIRKARLTGNEFLELLGNSRISNAAYNEIRDDRKLSLSRLTEILEHSALIDRDYDNILAAAFELADQKAGRSAVYHSADLRGTLRSGSGSATNAGRQAANAEQPAAKPDVQAESQRLRETLQKPQRSPAAAQTAPKTPAPAAVKYPVIDDEDFEDEQTGEFETQKSAQSHSAAQNTHYFGSESYENYDDYDDERTNTFKIIFSIICGVALMAAVLVMNVQTTGSIFPPEKPEVDPFAQPQNITELSAAISDLPVWYTAEQTSDAAQKPHYYLDTTQTDPVVSDFAQWQNRAFTLYNGTLTAYELTGSQALLMATYSAENATGIAVFADKLFLFSQSSYTDSFLDYPDLTQSDGSASDGGETPTNFRFSDDGAYTMEEVTVTVFDAETFRLLSAVSLDGALNDLLFTKDQAIIVTDYRPANNAAETARYPRAFMPTIAEDDEIGANERRLLDLERIYLPQGAKFANYTLICRIDSTGSPHISAVIGGQGCGVVRLADGKISLIQHEGDESRLLGWSAVDFAGIKALSFPDEHLLAAAYADDPGIESDGAFRVAAEHTLYLLDNDLRQIAQVTDIGAQDSIEAVLFSEKQAYYIGNALYVFDVSLPDEPLPVTRADSAVYSDEYLRYGADRRLSVTENGGNALSVTVYSAEYSALQPENTLSINDPGMIVLDSPAADNPGALWLDSAAGLIALPLEYHDGVSQVAEFRLYDYMSHGGFSLRGNALFYDVDCDYLRCCAENGSLYMFRADGNATALIENGGLDVLD